MSIHDPQEGEHVTFAGPGWTEPAGGRLLARVGSAAHVKWETGPEAGLITMVAVDDLLGTAENVATISPLASHAALGDGWDDSLEVGDGIAREGVLDLGDDEFLFGVEDFDG